MSTAPVTASTFPSTAIPSSAVWMNVANYAISIAAAPQASNVQVLYELLEHAISITDRSTANNIHLDKFRVSRPLPSSDDLKGLASQVKFYAATALRRDTHAGLFDARLADKVTKSFGGPPSSRTRLDSNFARFSPHILSLLPDKPVFEGDDAFSGWTWKEMGALAMLGGASTIDLQHGCPHQCLGCGVKVNKPKSSLNMDWNRQVRLASGIRRATHAFRSRGIDWNVTDPDKLLNLFNGSDPALTRAFDASTGKYMGFSDSALLFYRATGAPIGFTIPGWSIENEFIHGNVTRFVRAMRSEDPDSHIPGDIYYSVKPFALSTRMELDHLLDKIFDFVFNADDASIGEFFPGEMRSVIGWARKEFKDAYAADPKGFKDRFDILGQKMSGDEAWTRGVILHLGPIFFRDSRYVKRLIENIRFFEAENVPAKYSIQYFEKYEAKLSPLARRYDPLFSKQFVKAVFDYAFKKATGLDSKCLGKRCDERFFISDAFYEDPQKVWWDERFDANGPIIEMPFYSDKSVKIDLLHVQTTIRSDGTLELVFANYYNYFPMVTFSKEYLLARARALRSYTFPEDPDTKYSFEREAVLMESLASLVGKNVFSG